MAPPTRRHSARFRLTALACSLFFPPAVGLVLVTYFLLVLVGHPTSALQVHKSTHPSIIGSSGSHAANPSPTISNATVHIEVIGHSVALSSSEFLIGSCIVLVATIGVSVLLGWIVAGRVLQPLRVMTDTTRRISERNLHERLTLTGPKDELKDLGDTIDGLLGRLESAFDSQRRFVANASHELRTPLMLSQTLLQVALADPHLTLASLRVACQEAVEAGSEQAELIEALLTLARSQRGLEHRAPVDLQVVVDEAVHAFEPLARAKGLSIHTTFDEATASGDERLIDRLVSNLVDNAIRYNIVGGRIDISVAAGVDVATLSITNTGPPVLPAEVERLLEPFQRAGPDRAASPTGLGLGLSIVGDIAKAHGAALEVRARPQGGLSVEVAFPLAFSADDGTRAGHPR